MKLEQDFYGKPEAYCLEHQCDTESSFIDDLPHCRIFNLNDARRSAEMIGDQIYRFRRQNPDQCDACLPDEPGRQEESDNNRPEDQRGKQRKIQRDGIQEIQSFVGKTANEKGKSVSNDEDDQLFCHRGIGFKIVH